MDVIKTFFQDQDLQSTKCILEADRKAFFIFGRKRNCRRKWHSIYGRKRNKNENRRSFLAEKRKWKSPVASQPYNAPPIPRPVSPFFPGGPCWRDSTFLMYSVYLCGTILDDISTREQFAFLVYCYRVKAIFHNLSTVLYWRLCGLTNSPHC